VNGCRPFRELLSEALDGPLSKADQARLEAHLEGCAACRAYGKDLEAVRAAVKGVEEVEPPVGFATRVMAHVRAEAAPRPTVWQRLRPFLLKPQFQVATLLLVGITSALLIRSRSGMGDADVMQQMKGKAPAAEEASPAAPRPAEAPALTAPATPPESEALKPGDLPPDGKRRLPAESGKRKQDKDADVFAPPPPAQALGAASGAPVPARPAPAAAPAPAPAPPPAPRPEAAPESKVTGYTEPPKAAKPASVTGPGVANTAARADRAEASREARQPALDDSRTKKGEASLAKEQVAAQAGGSRDREKQEEDAVPAVFLVWEPEDPATAATVAAREVARLGGTVDRGGDRQQQAPRSLTGRIPAHQLSQLQARLSRFGPVRPGAGLQQQAPKTGTVVFLLRW
jgi:hypothetical protein